jgi:parallel beta-helix repeat protein
MTDDAQASPNTIQNNGENGITVSRASAARIVGNTISSNGSNGILINRVSHADVSSNAIDSNGGDGVLWRAIPVPTWGKIQEPGSLIRQIAQPTTTQVLESDAL